MRILSPPLPLRTRSLLLPEKISFLSPPLTQHLSLDPYLFVLKLNFKNNLPIIQTFTNYKNASFKDPDSYGITSDIIARTGTALEGRQFLSDKRPKTIHPSLVHHQSNSLRGYEVQH